MIKIYLVANRRGNHRYPLLATDTEVKRCLSIYQNNEMMILTHLSLQRLQYFRAQIPRVLLEGE